MADKEKGKIKELLIKMVLTTEGINFFIARNQKVEKFKMADNLEEYGVFVDNFSPASIQKLILMNYVSKIEISRAEFENKRQDIIHLTKLFVFSVIYKQLDNMIYKKILDSSLIKNWNRQKPGNVIDERTIISELTAADFVKKHAKQVQQVKKAILSPILARINGDLSLQPEERNIRCQICEKFLDNLRPQVWLILSRFQASNDFLLLLTDIREGIVEFLDKTKIAEYLSLMVMELVINAENSNMQKYVKKQYKDAINIENLFYDRNIRNKIHREMENANELLFLTWKMGNQGSSLSTRNKLQVILYNRESEYRKIKQVIDDRRGINLRKRSLSEFYRDAPDAFTNPELGLYYLSYLMEACEKVNVRFDPIVNQLMRSDLTVITLSLLF